MLTAAMGAMEQVDDSLAELADHFREHEHAYLELLRAYGETPGLLRDLARIIAELRAADLAHQLAKARSLRRAFLSAADALPSELGTGAEAGA